jgi:hypothetical protein
MMQDVATSHVDFNSFLAFANECVPRRPARLRAGARHEREPLYFLEDSWTGWSAFAARQPPPSRYALPPSRYGGQDGATDFAPSRSRSLKEWSARRADLDEARAVRRERSLAGSTGLETAASGVTGRCQSPHIAPWPSTADRGRLFRNGFKFLQSSWWPLARWPVAWPAPY